MNLSLAPLHGLTNRVFRNVYFRHFGGFDRVFAPFVVATPSAPLKRNFYKDLTGDAAHVPPLVPQILGNDAPSFLEAARAMAAMGYAELNWNLGCPYPMVANKFRGSGLLPHSDRIDAFLDRVCFASPLPISIKMRLGRWKDDEIDRLMPVLERYPLKEIILHPRTGVQMYNGKADVEAWAAAASKTQKPLVYNGDIDSVDAFKRISQRLEPIDSFMIGRWALVDPFLAADIRAALSPSSLPLPREGRLERLRAFMEDMEAAWREVLHGPAHVLDKMKELWSWTGLSLLKADRSLKSLRRVKTLDEYHECMDRLWETSTWSPESRIPQ